MIYLLIGLGFLMRLYFASNWLEDWDSVQFAMAIDNFSIIDHTPHPPGYPIYIFLGRLLNQILQSPAKALILLSVFAGSASIWLIYLLIKKIHSTKAALYGLLLLTFVPIHFLLSTVALSNIAGLFMTCLSAYIIYESHKSLSVFILASYITGLALGVRFAEYSILLSLLFLVLVFYKRWSWIPRMAIYLTAGIFTWLIPLVLDTGLKNFVNSYREQLNYIKVHDSLLSSDASFLLRLEKIAYLFEIGTTKYFWIFIILAILWLLIAKKELIKWKNCFILVWLLAYLLPLLFIYNLEVPRHILPLIPPIVIFASSTATKNKLLYLIFIAGIIPLLFIDLKLGLIQKKTIPPTIAPTLYIKENYSPQETTLVTTFVYRQYQYYAPQYANFWGVENAPTNITTRYVIFDYMDQKIENILQNNYTKVEEKDFSGDKLIYPRISKTHLYVFEKF